jgi:DNA-binding GntR family transcriptional regulator
MQDSCVSPELGSAFLPMVERQHLHGTVVDCLRKLIVEGTLPPGMKLNERELCERIGISRTPLREALKVLSAEGLVNISPNRGAFVSKMSEAEILETFELLSCLEAFSGELACSRITADELAEIKTLHDEMSVCCAQEDLSGYYVRNQAIHDLINKAARNTALRQVYLTLNRRVQALRYRSNLQRTKWDRAMRDHEEMIRALEARDGETMASVLRAHVLAKRDAVLMSGANTQDEPINRL